MMPVNITRNAEIAEPKTSQAVNIIPGTMQTQSSLTRRDDAAQLKPFSEEHPPNLRV